MLKKHYDKDDGDGKNFTGLGGPFGHLTPPSTPVFLSSLLYFLIFSRQNGHNSYVRFIPFVLK